MTARFAVCGATHVILGVAALSFCASQAVAGSIEAVKEACSADYQAYCSQHSPESMAVRSCMRANGLKLSRACISALIAAGAVTKEEVVRRLRAGQ